MIKLNYFPAAVKFHEEYVQDRFDELLKKGYILRNKKEKNISKDFLVFLKKYKDELISAKPERLLEIHNEYEKKRFSEHQKKLIKSFFLNTGYDNFPNKDFLNLLEIDTCFYCNRNYTLYFGGNHAKAELDHWFPKNEFSILALSFYNLIPSCHSCNHIKGAKKGFDWKNALSFLNHPYIDKNIFAFSYDYLSFSDFKFKINVVENSRTDNTLTFNKTRDIYNAHSKIELKDLLELRYKYSENYIKVLIEDTFNGIMSNEEIYRLIFGIEIKEKNYHKRPFSKYKHDIIQELLKVK